MYVKIIGDLQTEINIEYLPKISDILCIRDNFYRVTTRYYNTDVEEWALRVSMFTPMNDVKALWFIPTKGPSE